MKTVLIFLLLTISLFPQYTTPGTGVQWNMDSLVTNSSGAVTGSFPSYRVTSLITISSNDKLTIKPGTVVTFSALAAGFSVNGMFSAVGVDSNRINFLALTPDSTGSYQGFQFNDASIDSLCSIAYCNIFYAYYGLRAINASPKFDHNLLSKCRRGVQLSGSNSIISQNLIVRSYEYGITMTLGSSPTIEYCELFDNNTQNTSAKNQISIGTQGDNSPIIRNCKIHGVANNKTGGISISAALSGSSSNAQIYENEIYDNSYGIALLGGTVTAVIRANYIHDNNINPDASVSGSGINVNGTSANTPYITQNIIKGNLWGVTIQNGTTIQPGPQPMLGNAMSMNPLEQGRNIFILNGHDTTLYDLYNNCTNDIYAQMNDWGVYDSALIERRIVHKNDNPQLGSVFYMPFTRVIPVELVSFTIDVTDNAANLRWVTATETNCRSFQIFRRTNDVPYQLLAEIHGAGTTTERRQYQYTDKLSGSKYFYLLKQIDFDGTEHILGEREINNVSQPMAFQLFQNYPNPFNPSTTIQYHLSQPANVKLKVYDVLGIEIRQLMNEFQTAGNHSVEFNAADLPSGIYFYRLESGGISLSRKMILLR